MIRVAISLLTLVVFASTARAVDPLDPFPAKTVRSFVDNYCLSCHDSEQKKGGIDLDKLATNLTDPRVFAAWAKVYRPR